MRPPLAFQHSSYRGAYSQTQVKHEHECSVDAEFGDIWREIQTTVEAGFGCKRTVRNLLKPVNIYLG